MPIGDPEEHRCCCNKTCDRSCHYCHPEQAFVVPRESPDVSLSEDDEVYRIRQKSTGKWFGRNDRRYGCWHKNAGKFMTRKALEATIHPDNPDDTYSHFFNGVLYNDIEIVVNKLVDERALSLVSFVKKK